jgi:cell division protease FtsH
MLISGKERKMQKKLSFKMVFKGILYFLFIFFLITTTANVIKQHIDNQSRYDMYQSVYSGSQIEIESVLSATKDDDYLYFKTEEGMYKCPIDNCEYLIPQLKLEGKISNEIVQKEVSGISPFSNFVTTVVGIFILLFLISTVVLIWSIKKELKRVMSDAENNEGGRKDFNQVPPPNIFGRREDAPKNHEAKIPDVTLDDVQGIESIKEDVEAIIDALKNPGEYKAIGAKTSKGLVLYGPPGTGKTLLAKAIAGTAGVSFLQASGSDFIEKYVGVGASRIRDLYNQAKRKTPCIVFIDEIDAIGGNRGDSNNSERDQTINALLTELDGFNGTEGILTICATNRLDMLDPALVRAGRFDLKLAVPLPDLKARIAILRKHAEGKKLAMSIDLEKIAKKTVGFSGADLASLLNTAAINAVKSKRKIVKDEDIEEAFFKVVMNGNKKKNDETETLRLVAWHEAGHTLAMKLLTDDSVSSVTVTGSTSGAGGVTFCSPKEGIIHSKKYLKSQIKIDYAGRAAEQILLDDEDLVTVGASQDIKQASKLIRDYIGKYGMGQNGLLDVSMFGQFSVLDEASELAKTCYEETLKLLRDNEDILRDLAEALIAKETLDEDEIDAIISNRRMVQESIPMI